MFPVLDHPAACGRRGNRNAGETLRTIQPEKIRQDEPGMLAQQRRRRTWVAWRFGEFHRRSGYPMRACHRMLQNGEHLSGFTLRMRYDLFEVTNKRTGNPRRLQPLQPRCHSAGQKDLRQYGFQGNSVRDSQGVGRVVRMLFEIQPFDSPAVRRP